MEYEASRSATSNNPLDEDCADALKSHVKIVSFHCNRQANAALEDMYRVLEPAITTNGFHRRVQ